MIFKMSVLAGVLALLVSCGNEKAPTVPVNDCGIDLLQVQSAYRDYAFEQFTIASESAVALEQAVHAFENDLNQSNLSTVQSAFIQAYQDYQRLPSFDLGVGYEYRGVPHFDPWLNTFPAATDSIEGRISRGEIDLATFLQVEMGFPATEYLLFGLAPSDEEILARYNTTAAIATLLHAEVDFIAGAISQLKNYWSTSSSEFFLNTTGTGSGDPLSLLINALIKDYEYTKNIKLKIPAGRYDGGLIQPGFVEGKFINQTIALAKLRYDYNKALFMEANSENNLSLFQYFQCIEGNPENAAHEDITAQFGIIDDAWLLVNDPASEIFDNPSQLEDLNELITKMQQMTFAIKVRMTSLLNISINYTDADGD